MFNYNSNRPNNLRSSKKMEIIIPKPKSELFKGSMSYSGAKVWNTIPNDIRECDSIKSFTVNYTKFINNDQISDEQNAKPLPPKKVLYEYKLKKQLKAILLFYNFQHTFAIVIHFKPIIDVLNTVDYCYITLLILLL